jgi:hypothetical protein
VICQMHMYATHLMDAYNAPYTSVENNEELGVHLCFRIVLLMSVVDLDTVRWHYKLDGRGAVVDGEEAVVSCIKWQIDVDEIQET